MVTPPSSTARWPGFKFQCCLSPALWTNPSTTLYLSFPICEVGGHHGDNNFTLACGAAWACPLLWPCFVSPRLSSRGSPPFPSSPPTFPAQALRETFRGLQQTVRLLGASDVGRVGGGRSGAGRGLGRLCTPGPPTPAPGTRQGRQWVALTDWQRDAFG